MSGESTELEQNKGAKQCSPQGWSGRTGMLHCLQESLETAGPLQYLPAAGERERDNWCQRNEMGSIPSDGLCHMSCRCGGSGSLQNVIGTDLCFMR